jgi:hypothetical protein
MKFIEKQINIKIKQKFIQHSNYKLHEIFFQKYIYIHKINNIDFFIVFLRIQNKKINI